MNTRQQAVLALASTGFIAMKGARRRMLNAILQIVKEHPPNARLYHHPTDSSSG
jgi:hypothetical protein